MTVRRVMGIETEYGISVPGHPNANAMLTSSQIVNAYAAAIGSRARRARWDFEEENPLRDARGLRPRPRGRRPQPAHRRGHRPGQRHPHQRRPALRRPRPPRVLRARGHQPARRRALGQGRRARHGRGRRARRRRSPAPSRSTSTRTTPTTRAPPTARHENYLMKRRDAVRRHRPPPHAVLRLPPGRLRRRPGRHRRRTAASDGFQISQRADFFEVEVGLETTLKRPDHQHPRRAARRPGEVPPAARHHRRRQHVRDLDLPQARHDRRSSSR